MLSAREQEALELAKAKTDTALEDTEAEVEKRLPSIHMMAGVMKEYFEALKEMGFDDEKALRVAIGTAHLIRKT